MTKAIIQILMTARMTKIVFAAVLLLALCGPSAQAQEFRSTGDKELDARLRLLYEGSFIQLACPVPEIRPLVCAFKRSSSPNREHIIGLFAGDKANVIGETSVTSPIWGKGNRVKIGAVVYAKGGDKPSSTGEKRVELAAAQVDFFSGGFSYKNNIGHKPVYATKVSNDPKNPQVSYYNTYSTSEGRSAAKELLKELLGEPMASTGFQLSETDCVQTSGERLYSYRLQPEYITSFSVKQVGSDKADTYPVAVPVLDSYVQLQLDGDKLLCVLEYFWDGNLTPSSDPQECMQAGLAVLKAREWLMKKYSDNPPLLTVSAIKLGLIQDRTDRTKLIPVWLFDAGSEVRVREDLSGGTGVSESMVRMRQPFAVNALSGECIDLS